MDLIERPRLTSTETAILRDIAADHAPAQGRCAARCPEPRSICATYAEAAGTLRAHGLWDSAITSASSPG